MTTLLAIHPGALGDVMLSFCALDRLALPFSAVHLVCQDPIGKLAEATGAAARTFAIESALFAGLYGPVSPRFQRWLAGYDTVLLFSVASEPEQRLRRHFSGRVFRVRPRPEPGRRIHVVDYLADEIGRCGLSGKDRPMPAAAPDSASIFCNLNAGRREANRVLLHPGAGSRKKRWPASRFFELARRLEPAGLSPHFLLGPAETDLAEAVCAENRPLLVSEDALSLLGHLQGAAALVGNDSGVSHLAACLGLATVAVFGPSDPVRWAPRGRAATAVFSADLACAPCFEGAQTDCPRPRCLEAVSAEAVLKALFALLPIGG